MMLKLLVMPRLIVLKRSLKIHALCRRVPLILIGLFFWLFLFWSTLEVLAYVRGIALFGEAIAGRLFSLIFFGLSGFLVLSTVITAISSFYLSGDIPFLLSRPLRIQDIMVLKSIDTVLNSSWMVISFIPPVLIAFGISYQVSFMYYLTLLPVFILFILLASGIGITLSHLLVCVVPAKRMMNILLGAGLLLFLAFYLFLRSLVPNSPDNPGEMMQTLFSLRTDSPFLPGYWVTGTIGPLFRSELPDLFYALVLLSNGTFWLFVAFCAGSMFYRNNLEKMLSAGRGRSGSPGTGMYPGARMVMPYKDMKLFFRDTAQWSQVLIICSLIMVYVYNFRSVPISALRDFIPFAKELMVLMNMLLAGLVLSAVAARFVFVSVSLEGQAFWIIRTSPLGMQRFLRAKFLIAFLPVVTVMLVLVFLTNMVLVAGPVLMVVSLLTVVLLTLSVGGLGTGYGAIFPNFRYENINAVSMSLNSMIFMVIAFTMVIITLALEAWIGLLVYRAGGLSGMVAPDIVHATICLTLILAINIGGFIVPMKIGLKRLSAIEM